MVAGHGVREAGARRVGGCRWHEHLLRGAAGEAEGNRTGSDCHKWRLETPDGQWSEVDSTARVFGLFSGPALRAVRSCTAPYGTVDYQEDARAVREAAVEAVQESRREGWEGRQIQRRCLVLLPYL